MKYVQNRSIAAAVLCGLFLFPIMTRAEIDTSSEAGGAVRSIAADGNAFAFDLYAKLAEADSNLFFSPYSIDSALAMTFAGARGQTATQMAKVLHLSSPPEQLHAAFAQLIRKLNAGGNVDGKQVYELTVANAIWGQKGWAYQPAFTDLLVKQYAAGLNEVDFAHAGEGARGQINSWVAKQTKDKIKDLFSLGMISADTRLVLANAIYFKGTWSLPFEKDQTRVQDFHAPGGKTLQVPMMQKVSRYNYAENDDLQLIELPYKGDALSMVVLLPKKVDGLPAVEKKLSPKDLATWLAQLQTRRVELGIPRFRLEQTLQLADTLKSMGMTDAFDAHRADFTGIASEKLMIDKVVHKSYLDVNEEGTEAAAATGITMRPTAVRVEEPPASFRADHPFLFLIRDRESGAILFLSRVANPM